MAPARTRLVRKQNAGLLVGNPSFAEAASRSRSQPKMEDNLFTSSKERVRYSPEYHHLGKPNEVSKIAFGVVADKFGISGIFQRPLRAAAKEGTPAYAAANIYPK